MTEAFIKLIQTYPAVVWVGLALITVIVIAIVVAFLFVVFTGRSVRIGDYIFDSTAHIGVVIKPVKKKNRSEFSGSLVASTREEICVFGGDLSWLTDDLKYFTQIIHAGKKVKILVDSPDQRIINTILSWNVEVRRYPSSSSAPLKGFLIDPRKSHQGECRAVTIRKKSGAMGASCEPVYEFVEYRSNVHSEAVNGLISWFDTLFKEGEPVTKKT